MQVIINDLRQCRADSFGLCKIGDPCLEHALQPTEVLQQIAALGRPQARDGFEYRLLMAARAFAPMSLDREAVRFVPHALDQAQRQGVGGRLRTSRYRHDAAVPALRGGRGPLETPMTSCDSKPSSASAGSTALTCPPAAIDEQYIRPW